MTTTTAAAIHARVCGCNDPAAHVASTRCPLHTAFEADYCPSCGTSRVIGA